MIKNNKGFTLIELIVVLAIIGVLAGVLVPFLIGYVGDSKISTANANSKTLFNAAAQIITSKDSSGAANLSDGLYGYNCSIGGVGADDTFCTKVNDSVDNSVTPCAYVFKIKNGMITGICYARTAKDKYLGSYPKATSDKQDDSFENTAKDFMDNNY